MKHSESWNGALSTRARDPGNDLPEPPGHGSVSPGLPLHSIQNIPQATVKRGNLLSGVGLPVKQQLLSAIKK